MRLEKSKGFAEVEIKAAHDCTEQYERMSVFVAIIGT